MSEANTPGVGAVLGKHGLASIPEAHCYLAHEGARIDLTRPGVDPITSFLHEEEIEPGQIGAYKLVTRRKFITEWAEARGFSFEFVWRAREECIAALSELSTWE